MLLLQLNSFRTKAVVCIKCVTEGLGILTSWPARCACESSPPSCTSTSISHKD